jgi:hypothetical protein
MAEFFDTEPSPGLRLPDRARIIQTSSVQTLYHQARSLALSTAGELLVADIFSGRWTNARSANVCVDPPS